jgi:hypothetical protein
VDGKSAIACCRSQHREDYLLLPTPGGTTGEFAEVQVYFWIAAKSSHV